MFCAKQYNYFESERDTTYQIRIELIRSDQGLVELDET